MGRCREGEVTLWVSDCEREREREREREIGSRTETFAFFIFQRSIESRPKTSPVKYFKLIRGCENVRANGRERERRRSERERERREGKERVRHQT